MKLNKTIRWLCSGLLMGLSILGWAFTRPHPIVEWNFINILSLTLTFLAFFAIYFFALPLINRKVLRYSIPIGLFWGLCNACGSEIFQNDCLDYSLFGIAEKALLTISIGMVSIAAVTLILQRLPDFITAKNRPQLSPLAVFFISWGVILVCWIPCYIAFFPGIFAYDIPTQLRGISQGTLTADHPLLHTIIAWVCMVAGKSISSYTLGAAFYSLFQMLALSASFAACVAFLRRRGASFVWQALSLAWFAFTPIHPLFAVNATKDVLFAACTVVYLLITAELLSQPEKCLKSVPFWIGYILSVVVMALMRNTGIYVFIVFIPILVALLPGRRLLALALVVVCATSFFTTQTVLNHVLDVKEGRLTETLSVPLQQVARCAYDGVLNEQELAEVERFIPKEVWENYSSRLADPVKNEISQETIKNDLMEFMRLWIKLAFRHPGSYIDAFFGLNIGFWYPDMQYPDARTFHQYIETHIKWVNDEIVIEDRNLWPAARSFYQSISTETKFESIPIVALIFKPGIYFWLTICLFGASLFYRKRVAGGILAFLMLSWLLQLLSPIALL
ncbi:MAG: hypothetical protein IJ303_06335, partial [Clostridia bacterium]|nr:hypothetical protein [Clostridia bacterium]